MLGGILSIGQEYWPFYAILCEAAHFYKALLLMRYTAKPGSRLLNAGQAHA